MCVVPLTFIKSSAQQPSDQEFPFQLAESAETRMAGLEEDIARDIPPSLRSCIITDN